MMTHNNFLFTSDYNTDMHRHINDLFTAAKTLDTSREARLQAADDLVEAYVAHSGKRPQGNALERLATLILRDELTDTDRMKVRNNEYPILSDDQMRRREEGEVSAILAEDVATDGRDYRPRTRDGNRKQREMTRGL